MSSGSARGDRPGGDLRPATISGARHASRELWVERPDPAGTPAAWCYSDRRSYHAGDRVDLFLSATVASVRLRILHDSATPMVVAETEPRAAAFHPVPERAYETGCDWPLFQSWTIPADLPSGGYLIEILDASAPDSRPLGHHLIIVHGAARAGSIALVAATSTWAAYNDWGGANHYFGINSGTPRGRSPLLSAMRPWARGQVWLPSDAPRSVNALRPRAPGPARYDCVEWAFLNGFTKYYALAGWASYERPFLHWAEREGLGVEILTQDELHADPAALDGYDCVVFVGHDEYWSREMREVVDRYVEQGGRVARFAGNFLWQIRLEDDMRRQVAYKYDARARDPVMASGDTSRLTSAWEDPMVGWPGAATFGVNALRGIYAAFGGMARRAPRGFTVFRPEHWAFAGTGLCYADMFGDEANIFGFEMDGLDYTFTDGLPEPTGTDGAPEGLQILAMGWATLGEGGRPEDAYSLMLGDADARFRTSLLTDDDSEDSVRKHSRGSGMVVSFTKGAGEVFTAGTCEWVNGLITGDPYTVAVTRNVLARFCAPRI
ncbi:N,N-dimethylformamidase beta subunit family domain-containing protein [Tistrella sp. BH-R2-4]|uniref:N,N-dimethylformamidase beta subunit family domain-containing protein n=1 Tax=Tistrella arctica TaxID=3133430 RepID=A0ABU9YPW4_9PROT